MGGSEHLRLRGHRFRAGADRPGGDGAGFGGEQHCGSRDGFIVSATVTRGNFLCRVGQSVKAGQVLISGYTDCGICIQATRAEGEIYAQTSRDFAAVTPLSGRFGGSRLPSGENTASSSEKNV